MAQDDFCPTCHSRIAANPLTIRKQGEEGTDADGKPIPRWTDDPVLTDKGFSGTNFRGRERARKVHIEELQKDRNEMEDDLGLEKTEFSQLEDHNYHIRELHITELRETTEKILNAVGSTLEEYFKLDADGEEAVPGPNDEVKSEWTDVERGGNYINSAGQIVNKFTLPDGTSEQSPTFPNNTRIRAIHIEDLRHPIFLGIQALMSSFDHETDVTSLITAKKDGKVNFKEAHECQL